jgi:cytochrome c peroxidase
MSYRFDRTNAPTTFSNEFFNLLLNETWTERRWKGPKQYENSRSGSNLMMLPADLALRDDSTFRKYVELYAKDEETFRKDFAEAFSRLLELGVKFEATDNNLQAKKLPAHGQVESKSLWKRIFG